MNRAHFHRRIDRTAVVVVRDDKGLLRALANVCRPPRRSGRSRAARQVVALPLSYHGWTYDLTANYAARPNSTASPIFDARITVCLNLRRHLGPVCLDARWPTTYPLGEWLEPLPGRLAGLDLDALALPSGAKYLVACTGRSFVDNYLDGGYFTSIRCTRPLPASWITTHYRRRHSPTLVCRQPAASCRRQGDAQATGKVAQPARVPISPGFPEFHDQCLRRSHGYEFGAPAPARTLSRHLRFSSRSALATMPSSSWAEA